VENCLNHLTSGFTVDGLIQQLINGLSLGSIYALIALGYSMVYGVLELINFAHGDVFMIGTFAVLGVVQRFGLTDQTSFVIVIPALLVAMIAAMAL
jgi:branched-chain amino acid transport system permease protein